MIGLYIVLDLAVLAGSFVAGAIYGRKAMAKVILLKDKAIDDLRIELDKVRKLL